MGAQITVNEHCESEAGLHRAKVEIEDSESPADVVRREYYRSADRQDVVHSFIYFRKVTQDLRNYRVRHHQPQGLGERGLPPERRR